jgi:hypothetical protein
MKVKADVTKRDVNPGGHIVPFETDGCFNDPIAHFCEMGCMNLPKEKTHDRKEHLLRGGCLIADDFRDRGMAHLLGQLKMVFPDLSLEGLPRTHPMIVADYSNGIREYWEGSADPLFRIEYPDGAFKCGVNSIRHALTDSRRQN